MTIGMKYENAAKVLRLLFVTLITAHTLAILYHCVAYFEIYFHNVSDTWLNNDNIIEKNEWERYLYSFHFACKSMLADNVF